MDIPLQKKLVDTHPYVLISVSNSKEEIFYSSDPLEIQKHNLNGLAINSLIDINDIEYVIKDLSISVYSSPMKATTKDGRDVSYICDIKLKVQDK